MHAAPTTAVPTGPARIYVCSCGESKPHEIARRRTINGVVVLFWSDGAITDLAHNYPIGMGACRSNFSRGIARRTNEAIKDDVCMLTFSQVAILAKAVRKLLTKSLWRSDRDAVNYALQTAIKDEPEQAS